VELGQSLVAAYPGLPYARYLLGMAHYRAGQFDSAATELNAALTLPPDWPARRIALPGMAMALYRLGREADARSELDDAARAIDEWTAQICQSHNGSWAVHQGVGSWPIP